MLRFYLSKSSFNCFCFVYHESLKKEVSKVKHIQAMLRRHLCFQCIFTLSKITLLSYLYKSLIAK